MNYGHLSLIAVCFLCVSAHGGELLTKAQSRKPSISSTNLVTAISGEIVTIGLERVPHFMNSCPWYCVMFYENGDVSYEGFQGVEKKGRFKGQIETEIFLHLADFVRDMNVLCLPDKLPSKTTDATQYLVYIRTNRGQKLICDPNFPEFAHHKVWALGEVIESLLAKTKLKPAK